MKSDHSSFGERIHYFFDNTLSKGPMGLLIWLGIFVSLVIVLVSIFVWTTGVSSKDSIIEQAFLYMVSSLGAADADTDGNWIYRLATLIIIFSGIFVMSTLIGILTTAIDSKLEQLRKGRSRVIESGHSVILGWSEEILALIKELVIANENLPDACIVVLADEDKVEMEVRIRESIGHQQQTRIVCRSGNPMSMLDLEIVSLNTARSIVVLGAANDIIGLTIMKTVLAIINNPERRAEPYHIVAAIDNQKILDSVKLISEDEIEAILKGEFISKIEAQTLLHPGLSLVITDLLDFEGDEIYLKKEPRLTGRSYQEVILSYNTSAVIGFLTFEGQVLLNPPSTTVLGEHDQIIAVSYDDDTVIMSDQSHPPIDDNAILSEIPASPPAKHVLMLGWNRHSLTLIRNLSDYIPDGSTITVAASCNDSQSQVEQFTPATSLSLEHREIDPTDRSQLESLPYDSIDHIVILPCYEIDPSEPLVVDHVDTNTLVTLLNVRNIRQKGGYSLTITSEILDVENHTLVETSDDDDFVVSDHLISLALAQISENKVLGSVFNSLFDTQGAEIYLKPVTNYVKTGQPVNFFTVATAALRQNETAIGYRTNAQRNLASGSDDNANIKYDIVLNPDKRLSLEFVDEDKIIVLAESGDSS